MALSLQLFAGARKRHIQGGKFPSVSINDNKTVVEFYQPSIVSNKIFCKVGKLKGRNNEMAMCEPEIPVCAGRYPKVAISSDNYVVEVHEGDFWRYIYYNVGYVDEQRQCIEWWNSAAPENLCWGCLPAVAVYDNRVVVTCDYPYVWNTTYYFVGRINRERRQINWVVMGEKLFDSNFVGQTSVAINRELIVAVCRGVVNEIFFQIGHFTADGDRIGSWQKIDFPHAPHGYSPNVCLRDNGHILIVWQSVTLRRLMYMTGKIDNRRGNLPEAHWSDHGEHFAYDVGYNPSAAISPRDGFVIIEHETNFSGVGHCKLYYKAGTLIEVDDGLEQANDNPADNEQQQPAGEIEADEQNARVEPQIRQHHAEPNDEPMGQFILMNERHVRRGGEVDQIQEENVM